MGIINADARAIPLRDEVVQVVITSPPYWGLRDYGTGHWEGGVPFCSHGDGYKKGRGDYAVKEYENDPGFAARKAATNKMGFGRKTTCSCGATWVDPAIGLEVDLESYLQQIVATFREVRRVLRREGLIFVNMGDSYGKDGNLMGQPWRLALALQKDGWTLRSDIIWAKPNPMPEAFSVKRCTNNHEYLFMLSKSGMDYYWNAEAIKEPAVPDRRSCGKGYQRLKGKTYIDQDGKEVKLDQGWGMKTAEHGRGIRGNESWATSAIGAGKGPEFVNRKNVWTIGVAHTKVEHFATFPEELVLPCILAGSRPGDLVFDPFLGSGTIGRAAIRAQRRWAGTELNWDYCKIAQQRNAQMGLFA